MTADEIVSEVKEQASEWIEMSEDPATLVARILAQRIVKMNDYIEYLERRLEPSYTRK
jgi:hypothetical protein